MAWLVSYMASPWQVTDMQCKKCGGNFTPANNGHRYCSRECRPSYVAPKILCKECAHCGGVIDRSLRFKSKFCSDRCRWSYGRKYRYKNRRLEAGQHELTCDGCQKHFKAWHKRKFCGKSCRIIYTMLRRGKRRVQECPNCSVSFSRLDSASSYYCSDECKKIKTLENNRVNWAKSNALRKGAVRAGERIDPLEIFMRDGWSCKCCGIKTKQNDRGKYIDAAPELDHITPLSQGGLHTRDNVQLLCRKCNLTKGGGSLADQMLLFG